VTEHPQLIGLCGAIGAGKSALAARLSARHGYTIIPFAKPLKSMLLAAGVPHESLFGTQKEKETPLELLCGKSGRYAAQRLGEEWGRQLIGRDIWVRLWLARAESELRAGRLVAADDVRYSNEVEAIHRLGGIVVRIVRPDVVGTAYGHASEQSEKLRADYELTNCGTPRALEAAWRALMEVIGSTAMEAAK